MIFEASPCGAAHFLWALFLAAFTGLGGVGFGEGNLTGQLPLQVPLPDSPHVIKPQAV